METKARQTSLIQWLPRDVIEAHIIPHLEFQDRQRMAEAMAKVLPKWDSYGSRQLQKLLKRVFPDGQGFPLMEEIDENSFADQLQLRDASEFLRRVEMFRLTREQDPQADNTPVLVSELRRCYEQRVQDNTHRCYVSKDLMFLAAVENELISIEQVKQAETYSGQQPITARDSNGNLKISRQKFREFYSSLKKKGV